MHGDRPISFAPYWRRRCRVAHPKALPLPEKSQGKFCSKHHPIRSVVCRNTTLFRCSRRILKRQCLFSARIRRPWLGRRDRRWFFHLLDMNRSIVPSKATKRYLRGHTLAQYCRATWFVCRALLSSVPSGRFPEDSRVQADVAQSMIFSSLGCVLQGCL